MLAGGYSGFDSVTWDIFEDVSENAWYYDLVNYIASLWVIKGYDSWEGKKPLFKPSSSITRAELVKVVAELLKN